MRRETFVAVFLTVLIIADAEAQQRPRSTKYDGMAGKPAPVLRLPILGSRDTLALDSLRSQIVILNFWASWCAYCRKEHSVLRSIAREYRDRGVRVYGVLHADTEKSAQAFLRRYGAGYPTLMSAGTETALQYGVTIGLPMTFVVDRDARIRSVFIGGPITRKELVAAIAEAEIPAK